MPELKIIMLGGFRIEQNGESVIVSANKSPRFLQFFQMVLLRGGVGISRDEVLQSLYGTQPLRSPANSLNNLLFQLRSRLHASGLPRADYIVTRDKRYYPDPQVDFLVDAVVFRSLVHQAHTVDTSTAEELYREAFDLYQGPLLPGVMDQAWAERERMRLVMNYREVSCFLSGKAEEDGNEALGRQIREKSLRIHPELAGFLEDQTASERRAGEGTAAQKSFGRDTALYAESDLNDPADRPDADGSGEGREDTIMGANEVLVQIGEEIACRNRERLNGASDIAYRCSRESFTIVCHEMTAIQKRIVVPMHLMVFTLADYSGKAFRAGKKLEERAALLDECIADSLRKGDAYARIAPAQYAALMIGYEERERRRVMRSIRGRMRGAFGSTVRILWSESAVADADSAER